jgi:hypothetical protein
MTPVQCCGQLSRAGWSVWDDVRATEGELLWVVSGTNGENVIRAAGLTLADAWSNAVELARKLGTPGGDGDHTIEDRRRR